MCLGDAGAAIRATVTVSETPAGPTARSAEWTRHYCRKVAFRAVTVLCFPPQNQ